MSKYLSRKAPNPRERDVVSKKKLNRQSIGIAENIVFSKTARWAFYRIPVEPFDFLPKQEQYAIGRNTNNALVALMDNRQSPLPIFVINDSMPLDIDAWREQTVKSAESKRGLDFDDFIERQTAYLEYSEFSKKVAWIGVQIGKRGDVSASEDENVMLAKIKSVRNEMTNTLNYFIGRDVQTVTADEEKNARAEEERFYMTLSNGNLRAERVTAEEIMLLTKKIFYPMMPVPYLDVNYDERVDDGDIEAEIAHELREHSTFIKIRQTVGNEELVGYRTVLTMRKFPRDTHFPDSAPFLYALTQYGYPFASYARFTIHPAEDMRKLIDKKLLESKDEINNIAESGQQSLPDEVIESMRDMDNIKNRISKTSEPWIEGSYRIVVEADTLKKLRNFVSRLQQEYKNMGIVLHQSHGDQIQYLLEQMPGDTLRVESFNQVTTIGHLATSGFNLATEVGDDIAPRTERG